MNEQKTSFHEGSVLVIVALILLAFFLKIMFF
jgi:hypothetical protein